MTSGGKDWQRTSKRSKVREYESKSTTLLFYGGVLWFYNIQDRFTYLYDLNGNLVNRPERTFNADPNSERENLIWDKENRLTAVTEAADDEVVLFNIYDAGGERTLKTNNDNNVEITINGTIATPVAVDKLDDYTTYVNPYYILRKDYFTTHFYIEGERVATKLSEEDKDLGLFFHHKDHLGSQSLRILLSFDFYLLTGLKRMNLVS
ncbi:hypothetical protein J8281_14805 [Aquimarina sp. U1-2]|uniref:hypothetical protein n=1 Tax=Aquimarina sp. U1-2 TaxID=2823141 RepID=UPI001AEC7E08|nr:hypothetical protein [Aquimarina sp. U1-2]MBP2833463.1 hypothetical protein [Aquimarina sp. U1-2]